jgi:hypothetical protein
LEGLDVNPPQIAQMGGARLDVGLEDALVAVRDLLVSQFAGDAYRSLPQFAAFVHPSVTPIRFPQFPEAVEVK